ncbi:MAG TPA: NAD(P)/FAD-dependent oxidoreductase [Candidatus Cloacimonas sp.]|jgi:L-2-hydroxyglutarate oxidase LhgO|nr:NAD(P)/FAD-dependent oxidoreductase [Candidatus Cloacimonas sp.]
MEQVNILIIGAGVVGLAIANQLSQTHADVVVVEKEAGFGRHTSSRNSEVIHSGIYYPQNSQKAKLCVRGNQLLYKFCQKHQVPHKKCGKLVVANSENELAQLKQLQQNGIKNGVQNLQIYNKQQVNSLEPQIIAEKALWVPATGIVDSHKFMQKMMQLAEQNDAFVVYDMEVVAIEKQDSGYVVEFADGEKFWCKYLINSAGLWSDKIAQMAGIEDDNLQLHWCKGEYYKTNKIRDINHLIYPLPNPSGIYLGIHLTINLNNEVRFGPSAYYTDQLSYKMDESAKPEFLAAINHYLSLEADDLHLDDCGIRPKLQGPQDTFRDFYIAEETKRSLPRFINLIGIESPGLTAALAIAEQVEGFL